MRYNLYKYKATVNRVVDGDTMDITVDLGFNLKFNTRVRISDFDAPETYRPSCEKEKIHGLEAKRRAVELLEGKTVYIKTSKTPGVYGRFSAIIYLENGEDFATKMINEGFSKRDVYDTN